MAEKSKREIVGAIAAALRKGGTIWCQNNTVCRNVTPCASLACPFKGRTARAASPGELADCMAFDITEPAGRWEDAVGRLLLSAGSLRAGDDARGDRSEAKG